MAPSITRDCALAGSAVKAASRRLRRWPSASLDRLRPPAPWVAVIEGGTCQLSLSQFSTLAAARGTCRERAGWMVTVPPLGQDPKADFVDGSHPRGFLAVCIRNLGTDQCGPTGYEVMQ